jgi:lipoate synthase
MADLNQKLAAAQAALANERQARIAAVLDLAIGAGQITPAQRSDWAAKLGVEAQFANALEALRNHAPVLKTRALTLDMGGRKMEIANAASRQEAVQNLVRAEMVEHGAGYDRAFAAVRKAHPALFEAMRQPEGVPIAECGVRSAK